MSNFTRRKSVDFTPMAHGYTSTILPGLDPGPELDLDPVDAGPATPTLSTAASALDVSADFTPLATSADSTPLWSSADSTPHTGVTDDARSSALGNGDGDLRSSSDHTPTFAGTSASFWSMFAAKPEDAASAPPPGPTQIIPTETSPWTALGTPSERDVLAERNPTQRERQQGPEGRRRVERDRRYSNEFDAYHAPSMIAATLGLPDASRVGSTWDKGPGKFTAATRRMTPDERKAHTITGAGATANRADGSRFDTEKSSLTTVFGGGKTAGREAWVLDQEGFRSMNQSVENRGFSDTKEALSRPGSESATDLPGVEVAHHSTLTDGKAVEAAGEVEASKGRITYLNNKSGHYRPPAASLYSGVNRLDRAGMLSRAVGPAAPRVEAYEGDDKPSTTVDALAAMASTNTTQAAGFQKALDDAGTGPKRAFAGLGEQRITEGQADVAMTLRGMVDRRHEREELRSGAGVSFFGGNPDAAAVERHDLLTRHVAGLAARQKDGPPTAAATPAPAPTTTDPAP